MPLPPFVSVLMLTTYPKRSHWMVDALLSYQLQTWPGKELIVVNDGEPLEPARDGVKVLNVSKGLTLGARENLAAAEGVGKYFAVWDDDDFCFPDRLATQVAAAEAADAVFTRTSCLWVADSDLTVLGLVSRLTGASMLVRYDAFERVGGFPDTSWAYDLELNIRMAIRGLPRLATHDRYYVHRRHASNVSNDHANNTVEDHLAESASGVTPEDIRATNDYLRRLLAQPRVTYVRPARAT